MSQHKEDLNYRVKQIKFQGRTYPILLQDVNGPCPILAIANVLLLRGQLKLPAGVGEVSEERLVQLVAGYLLDATSLDGREGQVSEEYRANLAHNVSDAIALLPKLTTGIDVNLRFHDIRGFEFTNEVAVFDLLDIGLVHGWLCDPQDESTCCALGQKSYNELVIQLVTTLGGAGTPRRPTGTPRAFSGRQHGAKYAAAAALAASGPGSGAFESLPTIQEDQPAAGAAAAAPSEAAAGRIDADMLSAALQGSLHVAADGDSGGGGSGHGGGAAPLSAARPSFASSNLSFGVSESMRRLVDDLMQGVVQDSFSAQSSARQLDSARDAPEPQHPASATAAAAEEAGQQSGVGVEPGDGPPSAGPSMDWASLLPPQGEEAAAGGSAAAGGRDPGTSLSTQSSSVEEQVTLLLHFPDAAAGEGAGVKAELQVLPLQQRASARLSPFQSLTSESLTAHLAEAEAEDEQQAAAAAAAAAAQLASSGGSAAAQAQPAAEPISPAGSGITAGGSGAAVPDEGAVHDALLIQQFLEGNPSQLTWHGLHSLVDGLREEQLAVFFRNNHFNTLLKWQGGLYILVTDQGYQYEPDVVWEHLASVDGDTQFVDASFRPFVPHADALPAATGQAAAAEFGGAAAGGGDLGSPQEDADFALALALQQEEHDRLAREAQRSAEAAPGAPSAGGARPAQAARQQQQGRPAAAAGQQRPAPGTAAVERSGGSSSGSSMKKMKRKVKSAVEECVIM